MDVQEAATTMTSQQDIFSIPADMQLLDQSTTGSSCSTSSSFTTTTSSSSSSTATLGTSSARSSLSLPSFSSSSHIKPLPHSNSSPSSPWPFLRAASAISPDGCLHLRHLHLLRPLGSGHLARVYLCRLKDHPDDSPLFALKVVDLRSSPDAESHVLAESLALSTLDHPFLPTLYARLDAGHYACFLLDYCPGGDLHAILRLRPGGKLPPAAARFYAAEVLLALEYLHAKGFVYRDLKPENVLLRADGHIVLSDFDLAFAAEVSPSLSKRRRPITRPRGRRKRNPLLSRCFSAPDVVDPGDESGELEFVAEPDSALSKDCVGTHEYLAPEMVSGSGHGSGIDWWAFGVFLYELMYGRTPFKGASKEATLKNILTKELRFPDLSTGGFSDGDVVATAKDLIARLLERDPTKRFGARRGASEIKRHPFFSGVDWALIRCVTPPVIVDPAPAKTSNKSLKWATWNNLSRGSSKIRKSRGLFRNKSCSFNSGRSSPNKSK